MSQKIKLKPEFEEKLGDDKEKFLENLKAEEGDKWKYYLEGISDESENFSEFLKNSIIWCCTNEGHDFWEQVSKR